MKKPFKIECKIGSREKWGTWARYKTKAGLNQALKTLSRKWEFIEFREASNIKG